MIHIEGMGWMGSALAFRLAADGIDFTWNDIGAPHVAWRASTGIVYPAGDIRSRINLARWRELLTEGVFPAGTVTRAAYCYAHKNPPHAATYRPHADLGWIRVATASCVAVDVPTIVAAARTTFARHRTDQAPRGAPTIVAHGHTGRRASWVWGWSAQVRLSIPDDLCGAALNLLDSGHGYTCQTVPLALYGRAHRFAITYAYPVPTRPGWWWAGSSLISQRTPRSLDAQAHFASWRQQARDLYPSVTLIDCGSPMDGWRPKAHPNDETELVFEPGRVVFPPLWHSGVRWAPQLLDDAATWARNVSSGGGIAW